MSGTSFLSYRKDVEIGVATVYSDGNIVYSRPNRGRAAGGVDTAAHDADPAAGQDCQADEPIRPQRTRSGELKPQMEQAESPPTGKAGLHVGSGNGRVRLR